MKKVGFIGLGRMGGPMATNLAKNGFDLTVFDLQQSSVAALKSAGAKEAQSIGDLAAANDIVITMLPSSKEVEATVLGPGGLLANAHPGLLIMDMTTVNPTTTDLIAAAAKEHGASVVDAPVGRLAIHADRGESLFMVGASQVDFDRVLPLLQAMGTTIHHCGDVGAGIRTKLVNNYLVVVACQMNAEALALSQKLGLDLSKTLEVLNGTTATNGQLKVNWPNKVLSGDITPGFTIDLAHKDLSLILDAAQAAKVPIPLAAITREIFTMARTGKYAKADFSAIVDFHCDSANIDKPRLPSAIS